MKRAGVLGLFVAIAGLAGACGYSTGIRVSDRVHSVGVTFFGNRTLEPDVERPLQDAFSSSIRSLTDVPISDPAHAEVVLRGEILEYKHRGGIRSADNQLLETGLYIQVEAGLYDRQSDRALGPQRRAQVWIGYAVDDSQGESDARDRAIRYVSEELVLELFAPLE